LPFYYSEKRETNANAPSLGKLESNQIPINNLKQMEKTIIKKP